MTDVAPEAGQLFTVRVTLAYVLVIEWLAPGDARTGEDLFRDLVKQGIPARLVVCQSPTDVWQALVDAYEAMPQRGIPAIHIEAHGVRPSGDPDVEPQFTNNNGDFLRWCDIGEWLAPINEASGFQMLLVSASCWGHAAIATMRVFEHPVPFAACVGFSSSVEQGSLRGVMIQLYWCLLTREEPFSDAFDSAQRECRNSGEKLEFDIAPLLAHRILRLLMQTIKDPAEVGRMVARLRENFAKVGKVAPEEIVNNYAQLLSEKALPRCQAAWDAWFPPSLQQQNPAYRLDWGAISGETGS